MRRSAWRSGLVGAARCDDSEVYADAKTRSAASSSKTAKAWTAWPECSEEILRAMVDAFNSHDHSEARRFIRDEYLDHQGLGQGALRGPDGFAEVVKPPEGTAGTSL